MPNPAKTPVEAWTKVKADVNVSFASDNVRYPKEQVPVVSSEEWNVKAWKGEKVHTQILVWTKKSIPELSCQTGDLSDGKGHTIKSENIKAAFVRYVMTDEFGEGCDERTPQNTNHPLLKIRSISLTKCPFSQIQCSRSGSLLKFLLIFRLENIQVPSP